MTIQAYIPPALSAVHNFIRVHDADEILDFGDDVQDLNPGDYGDLAQGPTGVAEKTRATLRRDQIAQAMWESYQAVLDSGRYDILE